MSFTPPMSRKRAYRMRSHYVDDALQMALGVPYLPAQGKGLRRGGFPPFPPRRAAWQEAHDRTRDHVHVGEALWRPRQSDDGNLCIMTGKGFGCVGIGKASLSASLPTGI